LKGEEKGLKISVILIDITKVLVFLMATQTTQLTRYPRLDTVLMVEKFIKKHSGEFKKRRLWESLPKKMMYQTFCTTFDYLLDSGKIAVDREGKIAWIYNPTLFKKYIGRDDLGR
jgi:hypothetical protein